MENSDKHSISRKKDEGLMGYPHLGASYLPGFTRKRRNCSQDEGACCAVCGAKATEVHHLAPIGMGGGQTPHNLHGMGVFPTYTPLWAVCMWCHRAFHEHSLEAKWVSEVKEDPYIRALRTTNHPQLFEYGHYEIYRDGEPIMEVRR